jgi:hypothetical protein
MKHKTYLFEYVYGNSKFVIDIVADSPEEARGRLQAAGRDAKYLGELMGRVPASVPGAGWYVRFRCWLHNWFTRNRHA